MIKVTIDLTLTDERVLAELEKKIYKEIQGMEITSLPIKKRLKETIVDSIDAVLSNDYEVIDKAIIPPLEKYIKKVVLKALEAEAD